MESAADEFEITQRAIDGDGAALQILLKSHHRRILAYAAKMIPASLQGVLDPEDIIQDTYFEACRLIRGFQIKGSDSFFRWLATIARHFIIDRMRHQGVRRLAGHEGDIEAAGNLLSELAVYRRTPSKSAASHEMMAILETSLAALTPDYRAVLTYRHLDGLSVAETAVRMSKSNDAIYNLCYHALQAIRKELKSSSLFS